MLGMKTTMSLVYMQVRTQLLNTLQLSMQKPSALEIFFLLCIYLTSIDLPPDFAEAQTFRRAFTASSWASSLADTMEAKGHVLDH